MKNTLITIVIVLALFSCQKNKKQKPENVNRENLTQKEIDSVLSEFKFSYFEPVIIDSSDIIMIPIGTQMYRGRKSYRYSSDNYDSYSYSKYWNFTFNNTAKNTTSLLIDKKSFITDFSANQEKVGKTASKSIFYEMADVDYNQDNNLDFDDPIHLFISQNNGSNLKRVSPINENLHSWSIIPFTDKVIINTLRDSNKNLEFDIKDEYVFYLIDLNNIETKTELIDAKSRNKIEQLYFDSWLSTNNKK